MAGITIIDQSTVLRFRAEGIMPNVPRIVELVGELLCERTVCVYGACNNRTRRCTCTLGYTGSSCNVTAWVLSL